MGEVRLSDWMGPRDPRPYGDSRVRFIEDWVERRDLTEKEGRLIAERVDLIEVTPPGGDATCVRVENAHKIAYPAQWAAYVEVIGDGVGKVTGTPLRDWAPMPKFMVEEFLYLKVRTVEELSQLPADALEKWPVLRHWQEKAAVWLESANTKQSDNAKLKREIDALKQRYDKLCEQNILLMQRVEASEGVRLVPS